MIFKGKSYVFVFFLLIIDISFSQNNKTTSVFEFLRNESSSRAAALGGSFVCFAGDPNVIFYNPAAISSFDNKKASVGFLKHLLDVNGGYASYVQYLDILEGWFGGGIQYLNYGNFDQTDNFGNKIGEFSAGDFALILGYARKNIDNLSYGANIKIIYSSISDYSSMALAGDFGVFYSIPEQMINIGASILSLGSQVSTYSNLTENLPLDIKIGISKTLEHLPLNINLNFHRLNFSYDNFFERFKAFSLGGEFTLSEYIKFRIGYNNERRLDLKLGTSAGLAGFSLGLGILIGDYNFDYALSSYGKIGELHRINITTSF
jgi:hypothetical protein